MIELGEQLSQSEINQFTDLLLIHAYSLLYTRTIIDEDELAIEDVTQTTRISGEGLCQLSFQLVHLPTKIRANGTCLVRKGQNKIEDFELSEPFKPFETIDDMLKTINDMG